MKSREDREKTSTVHMRDRILAKAKASYDLVLSGILSFIVLFLVGDPSPKFFNDSASYMEMDVVRSPLYPLWLKAFRDIFGADYFRPVVFAQSILALLSVVLILAVCKKLFAYKSWFSLILWPFAIFPFISGFYDHVMYNRAILTEGLAYPLFYLYMSFFLFALVRRDALCLFLSFVLAGLMMVLRGQMMVAMAFSAFLGIWMLIGFLLRKKKGEEGKGFAKTALALVAGIVFALVFSKAFNLAYTAQVHGESFEPEFGNTSIMINFLYCADEADMKAFEADEDHEFIEKMFEKTFASGYTYANRGTSLKEQNDHLMDANLYLKIHMYIADAKEYYGAKGMNEVEVYKKYEEVAGRMKEELVPGHLGQWLAGFFALFFYGTADAVFFRLSRCTTLCYVTAYVLMFSALGLSFFCLKKKRAPAQARFMLMLCVMVVGNLAACCIAIGAIGRYLAYTWGLFYMAGLMLLYELVFGRNSCVTAEPEKKDAGHKRGVK